MKTFPTSEFDEIARAVYLATKYHGKQVRKFSGLPYIIHPVRVAKMGAELGMDQRFIAACYLHDALEDTEMTRAILATYSSEKTYTLVDLVTKWWTPEHPDIKGCKKEYYRKILGNPEATLLKVLDRIDNLRDFSETPGPEAARYLERTKEEFPPLLKLLEERHWGKVITKFEQAEARLAQRVGGLASLEGK